MSLTCCMVKIVSFGWKSIQCQKEACKQCSTVLSSSENAKTCSCPDIVFHCCGIWGGVAEQNQSSSIHSVVEASQSPSKNTPRHDEFLFIHSNTGTFLNTFHISSPFAVIFDFGTSTKSSQDRLPGDLCCSVKSMDCGP